MDFNLNLYKETIKDLVALGLTNNYRAQSLATQRERLIRDGIGKGILALRK